MTPFLVFVGALVVVAVFYGGMIWLLDCIDRSMRGK